MQSLFALESKVSNVLSLNIRDIHLSSQAKVILYDKRRKLQEVPILTNIVLHLQQHMAELDTFVAPYVLRHTKAMRLLETGINIFYIRNLLRR